MIGKFQGFVLICIFIGVVIGCNLSVHADNTVSGDINIKDTSSATGTVTVASGAPAFLSGWNYRKLHAIGGSPDGDLTNYPIRLQIYRDGITTQSGNVIQVGTNVTSDYRDIRFTDVIGNILPYWIESVNSTAAAVWVKLPTLPKGGAQLYVYYGNSTASSVSSGGSVFTLFDDFNSVNSNWTQSGGVATANSVVTLSSSGLLISTQTFNINNATGMKGTISSSVYNIAGFVKPDDGSGTMFYGAYPTGGVINAVTRNPSPPSSVSLGALAGTHIYEVSRKGTDSAQFSVDGVGSATLSQNIPTSANSVILFAQAGTMTADWVYVRPATQNEPVSARTTDTAEYNPTPPVASFLASPSSGLAPLTVQFNDTSSGSNSDWQWNFGDLSQNITTQNATHTFTSPGTYSVILTVNNSVGKSSSTSQIQVLQPPSFKSGWSYRKLHTITGSPDMDLPNYPIRLLVYRDGTTLQSGPVIQAGTNVKADFSDLRFTDVSGTDLSYWIESVNSTAAAVWVKLPTLPKGGAQLYVYYGNSTASSVSSGGSVFTLFDDFNSVNSNWTQSGGVATANSVVTLSSSGLLISTQTFNINNATGMKGTISSSVYNIAGFVKPDDGSGTMFYGAYPTGGVINAVTRNPSPPSSVSLGALAGTHIYEVSRKGTDSAQFSVDGVGSATLSQNIPTSANSVILFAQAGTMTADWVYVRPATQNEPVSARTTDTAEYNPTPPVASFLASPSSGLAPLTVQFNDTSSGSNSDWQWNFGDLSQNITTQNATHTFTSPGTYSVILTVNNSVGKSGSTSQIQVLQPPSFKSGWSYRKLHTITGSPDMDLPNYPVRLLVYRDGTTLQSGPVIQAGTNVKADFSDLRFTDVSGTDLSYWIESVNSTAAAVWVKLPTLPKGGAQLYVYYGNSTASSVSSGGSVFTLFDDFNSVNSNWTQSGGVATANSVVTLSSSGLLISTQTFNINNATGMKGTISSSVYNIAGFVKPDDGSGTMFYGAYPTGGVINAVTRNPSPPSSVSLGALAGTHIYEVSRKGTDSAQFSVDGVGSATLSQNIPTSANSVIVFAQAGTMTADWVYVRPATQNEPVSARTTDTAEYNPTPPVASFLASPSSGLAPLTVQFNDTSSGSNSDWQWNFGDLSQNITTQNATHTFTSPGTYSVILTVNNSVGKSSSTSQIQVLQPPSFKSGWSYRKLHTITGSPDMDLPNYPVRLLVYRDGTTLQSGPVIQAGTNVKADFSDLRFTDVSGTDLSYWIESVNSTAAAVWVKLPTLPKGGAQLYVYYGNSTASSVSSGGSVFTLFDDFNSVNSNWTQSGGVATANSVVTLSSSGLLISTQTFNINNATGMKGTISSSVYNIAGFVKPDDGSGTMFYGAYPTGGVINAVTRNPSPPSSVSLGALAGTHIYEVSRKGTDSAQFSVDGVGSATLSQNIPTSANSVILFAQAGTMTADWVYVRPATQNEPVSARTTDTAEYNPTPPVASFLASPSSGLAPLTVQFNDTSSGSNSDWQWNFGDLSQNITTQNATHTFTSPGTYSVILTVNNSVGKSSSTSQIQVLQPPSFKSGWSYRKLHTITGSPDMDLPNYPVRLLVYRDGTTLQSGPVIQAGTNVKADFSDLRFTDVSGTDLSYWIESVNSTAAAVWVKLPTLPKGGAQLYVYYGNSTASSVSSGGSVFTLFDDFNSVNSNWTQSGGVATANSVVTLSSSGLLISTQTFNINNATGMKGTISSSVYNIAGFVKPDDGSGTMFYGAYPTGGVINAVTRNPSPPSSVSLGALAGTHIYEVSRKGTDSAQFSVDGVGSATLSQNIPTSANSVILFAQAGTMTADWVYVRPATQNEPVSIFTSNIETGPI